MLETSNFSIVSFNVNGLKPALKRCTSENLPAFLDNLLPIEAGEAVVICLQEVKLESKDLDRDFSRPAGWECYYSLSNHSTISSQKLHAGYSGVATFCKSSSARALDAREGLCWVLDRLAARIQHNQLPGSNVAYLQTILSFWHKGRKTVSLSSLNTIQSFSKLSTDIEETVPTNVLRDIEELKHLAKKLDMEGRCVITHHGNVIIINVYAPAIRIIQNGTTYDPDRLEIKSAFHCLLHLCIIELRSYSTLKRLPTLEKIITYDTSLSNTGVPFTDMSIPIIILGDFNVQLTPKDSSDPLSFEWKLLNLPFIDQTQYMLDDCKLVDSFRYFHPESSNVYTCWNQLNGARLTNFGSRIDFIFINDIFLHEVTLQTNLRFIDSQCHTTVPGSDHCPISLNCHGLLTNLFFPRPSHESPPTLCATFSPGSFLRQQTLFDTMTFKSSHVKESTHLLKHSKHSFLTGLTELPFKETLSTDASELRCVILLGPKQTDKDFNVLFNTFRLKNFNVIIQTSSPFISLKERQQHVLCTKEPNNTSPQSVLADIVYPNRVVHLYWSHDTSTVIMRFYPDMAPLCGFDDISGDSLNNTEMVQPAVFLFAVAQNILFSCLKKNNLPKFTHYSPKNILRDLKVNDLMETPENYYFDFCNTFEISKESMFQVKALCNSLSSKGVSCCSAFVISKDQAKEMFASLNLCAHKLPTLKHTYLISLPSVKAGNNLELQGNRSPDEEKCQEPIPLSLATMSDQLHGWTQKRSYNHIISDCDLTQHVIITPTELNSLNTAGKPNNTAAIPSSTIDAYSELDSSEEAPQREILDKNLLDKISFLGKKEKLAYLETASIAPLCLGHGVPCIKRKVKKQGYNEGREFWACALPESVKGDSRGKCDTFHWVSRKRISLPMWVPRVSAKRNKQAD